MGTTPSIYDLVDARYMALDHKPNSPQAHAMCKLLAAGLAGGDDKRTYRRRGVQQQRFEDAVGRVVADLLLAYADNRDGWSFRSSGAKAFTGDYVSYRTFTSIMTPALAHGLVECVRGFHKLCPFSDEETGDTSPVSAPGNMTNRYRATPALRQLAQGFGITPDAIDQHFLQDLPKHPLELRTASFWTAGEKIGGKPMPYKKTPRTEHLEAELHELNRFNDTAVITGGTHRGYRRIFSQGDKPEFDWNKGGRLYSQGRHPYQQLPSEERLKMTINGEPVAEIDVSGSLLAIMHGALGKPFDATKDPYSVGHYDQYIPRAVVKTWVTMTIGYQGFHDDWPKGAVERLAQEGIDVTKRPIERLGPLILHYIPILEEWPQQKPKLTCHDLMFHESTALLDTMLTLKREHQLPSLSVHDSLIVPISAVGLATQLLKESYGRVCGVEPGVKVKMGAVANSEEAAD